MAMRLHLPLSRLPADCQAAAELLPLVYDELRALAAARLAVEAPGQTLQATALVHEVYLRLIGPQDSHWENRSHFFAAAAQAMRRILVESARSRGRLKRGGRLVRVELLDVADSLAEDPDLLLSLDELLSRLAEEDERRSLSHRRRSEHRMRAAESQDRTVFRIALTQDEQRVVNAERDCHPDSHVRRKSAPRNAVLNP